ncbi:ankyrin repeat protein, partial [Ochromonadaceae sp. CCMP2298]
MALLAAALHEDVPCIEQLLRKGANPSCVDDQIRSPSHYAARTGNAEVLALLFDHGADLEAADAAGRTPLHTAVIFGRTRALDFLLGCAVDCDSPDLAGNAPLHLAARAGFLEGCAQLLRFG